MPASMNDQAAIITGGSRGICLAAARAILDRGGSVCITGRHQEVLDAAVAYLDEGDRVLAMAGHVSDADHRSEVVDRTLSTFGSVDVLVNGVGINPYYGTISELDEELAVKMFRTNVLVPLEWFKLVEKAWMAEHGGAVVNLSSAGAFPGSGGPLLGAYNVTKAALVRLTEHLALEKAPLRIRVNAVAPGTVRTNFAAQFWSDNEEAAAAAYPLGRAGEPEDVGEAIAYLASADAGWITGQTLAIEGGFLLTSSVDELA